MGRNEQAGSAPRARGKTSGFRPPASWNSRQSTPFIASIRWRSSRPKRRCMILSRHSPDGHFCSFPRTASIPFRMADELPLFAGSARDHVAALRSIPAAASSWRSKSVSMLRPSGGGVGGEVRRPDFRRGRDHSRRGHPLPEPGRRRLAWPAAAQDGQRCPRQGAGPLVRRGGSADAQPGKYRGTLTLRGRTFRRRK